MLAALPSIQRAELRRASIPQTSSTRTDSIPVRLGAPSDRVSDAVPRPASSPAPARSLYVGQHRQRVALWRHRLRRALLHVRLQGERCAGISPPIPFPHPHLPLPAPATLPPGRDVRPDAQPCGARRCGREGAGEARPMPTLLPSPFGPQSTGRATSTTRSRRPAPHASRRPTRRRRWGLRAPRVATYLARPALGPGLSSPWRPCATSCA